MNLNIDRLIDTVENNKIIVAVQNGLVIAIPAIMAGSISLMILSIPIKPYQLFFNNLMGGMIFEILRIIHSSTIGIISLIFLITISHSYEKIEGLQYNGLLPIISLCSYIAFAVGGDTELTIEIFNGVWLFNAIIISIVSSTMFVWLNSKFEFNIGNYSDGADMSFNNMILSIVPACAVILFFPILNLIMTNIFGVSDFQLLATGLLSDLFNNIGVNIFSAILFIFLMHFMWFFGIHGSTVLDRVARQIFEQGTALNFDLVLSGEKPTEIFTKTFFDTFVLFGGCGTALCLVIAMLIWEKRNNTRQLAKFAFLPAIFNMNELIIFGIPIVLNPIFIIPFICTPLILTLVSWFAMLIEIVPYTVRTVEWTIPIFLSGYAATGGHISGSFMQLFNLVLGIFIYMPFVNISQKVHLKNIMKQIIELENIVKQCEDKGEKPVLIYRQDKLKSIAKMLASDMQMDIKNDKIKLFYQPQIDCDDNLIGAEALLRWKHSIGGYIYPPLAIAIADEAGFLNELGMTIIDMAGRDLCQINSISDNINICISFNVTAEQLEDSKLIDFIKICINKYNLKKGTFGLEITEQTVLSGSQIIVERLTAIKEMGVQIIMDDFGMGHSSLKYLQNNHFDIIKLDGTLVIDLMTNKRCSDIISSIIYLSNSLDFAVLAEYVETEEQMLALKSLGCMIYQGYLYSPAIELDKFIEFLKNRIN